MRPLRYTINITVDGCCDHRAGTPSEELHQYHAAVLERADALLFGRVTYEMMREAWQRPASGTWPDWMADWMYPFAETMDAAKKYVVSSTLENVGWNTEVLHGDLREAVQALKDQPGNGIAVGGVTLPRALAELGLIDEYEFVVHPTVAGHGPHLLAGLSTPLDLEPIGQQQLAAGLVSLKYRPVAASQ